MPDQNSSVRDITGKIVEELRPRLLDLSKRNQLISTRFSEKSNSHIRIVDELPEVILQKVTDAHMKFIPLPDLSDDPEDENTREFNGAVSEARMTDPIYLSEIEKIDQDSEYAAQELIEIERRMKDRVRQALGMPLRQTKQGLSLAEHAKIHNIRPSYELPKASEKNEDGRHIDDNIQTLLLPEMLERRLSNLTSKCNSWLDETGINVLKIAYGFLEWSEQQGASPVYSPLILQQVDITKKKTPSGIEFKVTSSGEPCELNFSLKLKLEKEFGVSLPDFDGEKSNLEEYFEAIHDLNPKAISPWRVRRQVAVGVFPSAGLTMYQDLASSNWEFSAHPVISQLFGGSSLPAETPLDQDQLEIEPDPYGDEAPFLIADADFSQFKVIADLMKGKNLAVEGPPGSGKSQTIVNSIAAAILEGKKVLFVAEKAAALNVVKSRLDAYGIGDFCLPLLANRTTRESVYKQIKKRDDLKQEREPKNYSAAVDSLVKTKNKIEKHLSLLESKYKDSEYTNHDIISKCIYFKDFFDSLPEAIRKFSITEPGALTEVLILNICTHFENFEKAVMEAKKLDSSWSFLRKPDIDPYLADDILNSADQCAEKFETLDKLKKRIESELAMKDSDEHAIQGLKRTLDSLSGVTHEIQFQLAKSISEKNLEKPFGVFLSNCEEFQSLEAKVSYLFNNSQDRSIEQKLTSLKQFCRQHSIENINSESINGQKTAIERICESLLSAQSELLSLFGEFPKLKDVSFSTLKKFLYIIDNFPEEIIDQSRHLSFDEIEIKMLADLSKRKGEILARKEDLDSIFHLSTVPNQDILNGYIEVLSNAGPFRVFSSKYRATKRAYKSISKRDFDLKDAESNFRQLSSWKYQVADFENDKSVNKMLGHFFSGLETDFDTIFYSHRFNREVLSLPSMDREHLAAVIKSNSAMHLKKLSLSLSKKTMETISNFGHFSDLENLLSDQIAMKEKIGGEISEHMDALSCYRQSPSLSIAQLADHIGLVKRVFELQDIIQNSNDIKAALGSLFNGTETEYKKFRSTLNFLEGLKDEDDITRISVFQIAENNLWKIARQLCTEALRCQSELQDSLDFLNTKASLSISQIESMHSRENIPGFLRKLSKDKEGLIAFSKVSAFAEALEEYELKAFAFKLLDCDGVSNYSLIFQALLFQKLGRKVYNAHGSSFAKHSSDSLNLLRKKFAELDIQHIEMTRQYIRSLLIYNASPPQGSKSGSKRDWTDMAFINNELSKKKRFSSLRKLTSRAGDALLELMPCWMMSPTAVSQYLTSGQVKFDIVIIDEASQMTPEDSVGALLRGNQAMIVGDTNQLPPTNFFRQSYDDEEDDDESVTTNESILEIANGVFRPKKRLRWHYRSRHSGLIAFSNKYVYDSDLEIFPSPDERSDDKGVFYQKVDGIYNSSVNSIEARTMVDAIIQEMRRFPGNSLGVVTLNQSQKELIQGEFEFAVKSDKDCAKYIEKWESLDSGLEKFFIKNLENVQGDERDTIFIGTVYGPSEPGGPVMQRFGPINGPSGKRRLNVLFSRAKRKIVTFSSMTSDHIKAESHTNPGTWMLKKWLEYSASNVLESGIDTKKEPDSDFERYVIKQIESMGCEAVPQVGVSGYYIDIGVRHPKWEHGYILGVECDGASYHSSKIARERDRLREQVLRDLGWEIHRIWSTSWFEDPQREAARMRKVIEDRLFHLGVSFLQK